MSGTGYYWQDRTVSLTAAPAAAAPNNYTCDFRVWQDGGVDQTGTGHFASGLSDLRNPLTWLATSAKTSLNCRFLKWLYNGYDTTTPDKAGWRQGKASSHYDAFNHMYTIENGMEQMRIHSWSNAGWSDGELAGATLNKVDFTGSTRMQVLLRQPSNNGTLHNTTCVDVSGAYNDGYGSGQKWTTDTSTGWHGPVTLIVTSMLLFL